MERLANDEPLNRILEVRLKHGLAVGDLLRLRVVVVLDFELAHIELGHLVFAVKSLHQVVFADAAKSLFFSGCLDAQGEVFHGRCLRYLAAQLKSLYIEGRFAFDANLSGLGAFWVGPFA